MSSMLGNLTLPDGAMHVGLPEPMGDNFGRVWRKSIGNTCTCTSTTGEMWGWIDGVAGLAYDILKIENVFPVRFYVFDGSPSGVRCNISLNSDTHINVNGIVYEFGHCVERHSFTTVSISPADTLAIHWCKEIGTNVGLSAYLKAGTP